MKLSRALRLAGGESVAFVGAGGKTSAMFELAGELPPPVFLTTTTHLGAWQAPLADQHYILNTPEKINQIQTQGAKKVLLTGNLGADNRLAGLDKLTLGAIHQHCQAYGYSLLIEADGARQRPLKAPAGYEPVIPLWVDQVVVMAGLAGLGEALDQEIVHRPEIFAQLSSCGKGETLQAEHLISVLRSPEGGLKGIPADAERVLFLNQAEGVIRMAQANRIAHALSGIYDRVLIGSLQQKGIDRPIISVHMQTAGVILAAGGSQRLGRTKQLLDWCGKPFVVRVAGTAVTAGLDPIIVVTGADQELVEEALAGLSVTCIHNPAWQKGQSTSMKTGLAALPEDCLRVMFFLSDQPQVSPILIRGLIERHNTHLGPITAPLVRGQRGNPVLFSQETYQALGAVSGDKGGRGIFNQFTVDYLDWVDARDILDVDQGNDEQDLFTSFYNSQLLE
jgi:molybdenum cofactor cytidylyltransferase